GRVAGRVAVAQLTIYAVTPTVGVAVGGDATGVISAGGDSGECEVTGHWLGCGIAVCAAVAQLAVWAGSPTVGVAVGGDATGVIPAGGDVGEGEVTGHWLGCGMVD